MAPPCTYMSWKVGLSEREVREIPATLKVVDAQLLISFSSKAANISAVQLTLKEGQGHEHRCGEEKPKTRNTFDSTY